mgnify:CR=1 FL=1
MGDDVSEKEKLLRDIAERVATCKRCPLWRHRRNPVPGEGNPNARIMFIGEAPGYQEDLQGRPFVGAAGKLLTSLIENILGVRRSDVYITNILKCRPPNNRDPRPEEVEACTPFLDEQIRIICPEVIVCLGRHSAKYILSRAGRKFSSILSVRGSIIETDLYGKKTKIIATIHPAAALYRPPWKKMLEEDFRIIRRIIEYEGTRVTLDEFV